MSGMKIGQHSQYPDTRNTAILTHNLIGSPGAPERVMALESKLAAGIPRGKVPVEAVLKV